MKTYDLCVILIIMKWKVIFDIAFETEFRKLGKPVQDELLAHAIKLETLGPQLGRPTVDTLKESAHSNMKELRFNYLNGVWRVAFAFDPIRRAIILVAGDKKGKNQRKFYKDLIRVADERFERHLKALKGDKSNE